jgi:hypothetical protein
MSARAEDAGTRASEALLTRREDFASAITDALYADEPALLERYGAGGLAKCREDMRYTIEHLAPAVALHEPQMFVRYVTWLVDLLRARAIPADDVRATLAATKRVLAARFPADEYSEIEKSVEAALRTLFPDMTA